MLSLSLVFEHSLVFSSILCSFEQYLYITSILLLIISCNTQGDHRVLLVLHVLRSICLDTTF